MLDLADKRVLVTGGFRARAAFADGPARTVRWDLGQWGQRVARR